MKELTVKCSCGHSIWTLWEDENNMNVEIYIQRSSLKDRLRGAWEIITKGRTWADDIVFDKDGINQVKEFINTSEL